MTDDRIKRSTPNKEESMAVDDMGIPILEEIVTQKSGAKPKQKTTAKSVTKTLKRNISLPNNEILVKALRNQLRSQVNKDINEIAAEVASKVVCDITQELEQKIKTELIQILQCNLDEMINHAITGIPNSKK